MSKLWFDKEIDPLYISDQESECPAVREFKETVDYDDWEKCRSMWLPFCTVCPRESYCYTTDRLRGIK